MQTIHLLEGINLGRMGKRMALYGNQSTPEFLSARASKLADAGVSLVHRQSDHEGEFVGFIHQAQDQKADGIIINPGAWSHTSIALLDALLDAGVPFVEVHLTNTASRESFRAHSYISKHAHGIIQGLGHEGYMLALQGLMGRSFL